jgi:hypothetical protein
VVVALQMLLLLLLPPPPPLPPLRRSSSACPPKFLELSRTSSSFAVLPLKLRIKAHLSEDPAEPWPFQSLELIEAPKCMSTPAPPGVTVKHILIHPGTPFLAVRMKPREP